MRSGFTGVAKRVQAAGWDVDVLDAGHMAMEVAPWEVARLLCQIGGRQGSIGPH